MKKRVLSVFIAFAMLLWLIPASALADSEKENCIQNGSNTYSSLTEAVKEANAGDTLWLIGDDATEQQVTIDKSITIELQGYAMPSTALMIKGSSTNVAINDRVGTGSINKNHYTGFATAHSRCTATVVVDGGATLTVNGVTGKNKDSGTIFYDSATSDLVKAIFVQGASTLIINGGTFVAQEGAGRDALFVYNGTVTINDGYFYRYISYNSAPTTEKPLTIKKCEIYNPNGSGAVWIESSGNINGSYFSSGNQSLDSIKKVFLATSTGSYVLDGSVANHVIIGCGIYASEAVKSTTLADGTIYAVGSTDGNSPETITPTDSDKITLAPQIAGGDGTTITYTWEKNGNTINGADSATYTIDNYSTSDDGTYKVTATESNTSVSLYYKIGNASEDTVSHSDHCICGVEKCSNQLHGINPVWQKWESIDSLPAEAGNYYLTKNVTLSDTWEVSVSGIKICLNGKSITGANSKAVIKVSKGGDLTITDCAKEVGKITHKSGDTGRGITNNGTFTLWNGNITGNNYLISYGGGIYNSGGGKFTMYGGFISDNSASCGGGVYTYTYEDIFTMYGGTITGNKAERGGGVYNIGNSILTAGNIIGNNCTGTTNYGSGGGIYNVGTLTMSGTPKVTANKMGGTFENGTLTGGTEDNVYLYGNLEAIKSTGLADGASVGITAKRLGNTVVNGTTSTTGFFSDNAGYYLVANSEYNCLKLQELQEQEHSWSAEWTSDGTYHWHKCSDVGCEKTKDYAAHTYGDLIPQKDATCIATGMKEYYQCFVCKQYFDAQKGVTTLAELVIAVSSSNHDLEHHQARFATCTEKGWEAYDTCKRDGCHYTTYEEIPALGHNLTEVYAVAATYDSTGNIQYWVCNGCGKYFSDKVGENEITQADTVVKKLPVIIEGNNAKVTQGTNEKLAFTSDAEFADFIRVDVDGKTLESKQYTVASGSTIVTLNTDYVATLAAGEHTLDIVSQNGTATAKFTVTEKTPEVTPEVTPETKPETTPETKPETKPETTPEITPETTDKTGEATTDKTGGVTTDKTDKADKADKAANNDNTASAQTGDSNNIMNCMALLFISGGAVIGMAFVDRKKKYNR